MANLIFSYTKVQKSWLLEHSRVSTFGATEQCLQCEVLVYWLQSWLEQHQYKYLKHTLGFNSLLLCFLQLVLHARQTTCAALTRGNIPGKNQSRKRYRIGVGQTAGQLHHELRTHARSDFHQTWQAGCPTPMSLQRATYTLYSTIHCFSLDLAESKLETSFPFLERTKCPQR